MNFGYFFAERLASIKSPKIESYKAEYALSGRKRPNIGQKTYGRFFPLSLLNGIRTHDLRNTSAMLYHLSYEAGQVRVQFIPII